MERKYDLRFIEKEKTHEYVVIFDVATCFDEWYNEEGDKLWYRIKAKNMIEAIEIANVFFHEQVGDGQFCWNERDIVDVHCFMSGEEVINWKKSK